VPAIARGLVRDPKPILLDGVAPASRRPDRAMLTAHRRTYRDATGGCVFQVQPKSGASVRHCRPNSGVVVLPTTIAPARFKRATATASALGT
jgi:hypothetical protein